MSSTMVFIEDS